MPHITTYTGLIARNQASQPTDDFIKLGDIKGEFQMTEFTGDSLIGVGSDSPNYMTGQGGLSLGVLRPLSIVQQDGQTFYKGPGGQLLGPLGGEGVFRTQSIEDKGSVIVGDNHFTTGGGSDSIHDEGRSIGIWTNGGASTFEDSSWIWQDCNDVKSDQDNNDVLIGVKENIDWTAANGGPGSSYLTAKTASKTNAYVDEDVDGFMKLGDIKGELQTTDLRSDNRFVIERFEPAAGMDSFGESFEPLAGINSFSESLNSVLEVGGNAGPLVASKNSFSWTLHNNG
jgi:hypothetical protein